MTKTLLATAALLMGIGVVFRRSTLNVYSQIGLITKNGILILVFANSLFESHLAPNQAVVEASALRLRPIAMTSLTMILGAGPQALASGAAAEGRAQIGWVIVGGMTVGTFLTIFVIPSVDVSFARIRRHRIAVTNA